MPKEIVYGEGLPFGPDSSARSIVELRWGRDAFVEIGSRIVHASDLSDYVPSEQERPGANGQPIAGQYMSLDRSSINTMIKNLRRARDQAFGRDE